MNKIIKTALARAGMSQKQLAEAIHVTPQAVSKWVTGESRPTQDNIVEIYKVLGVDLTKEMVKASRKDRQSMTRKHCGLSDLNNIQKAKDESKLILEHAGVIQNYSHTVAALVDWLVTGTIGMLFYRRLLDKDNKYEYDYDYIKFELEDFFEQEARYKGYQSKLAYSFYLFGTVLFEAGAEYEMEQDYVDYGHDAMSMWYNFESIFSPYWSSPLLDEVKVALLEVISSLE